MDDNNFETVKQHVIFHMSDETQWSTTVDIHNLADLLEDFRDPNGYGIIHVSNDNVEWYIRREHVIGLVVFNLEELEEINDARSRTRRPPAKSRC